MKKLLLLLVPMFLLSCSKDSEEEFSVDFTIEEIGNNIVRFTDNSKGGDSNSWSFEDGTTFSNKSIVEKYYPLAGEYSAKLTVFKRTESKNLSKAFNVSQNDIVADFSFIEGEEKNTFIFQNDSSGQYDSLEWDFGNNVVSDKENPDPVYYPFKGTYTATLTLFKGDFEIKANKFIQVAEDDNSNSGELVWSDEFDGQSVNLDNWTFETGANGWGNNELQKYTNGDNAEIRDGKLVITARKINDNQELGSYTSTRMITRGKQTFTYGRLEARIKLPSGRGTWPAFWMLGENFGDIGWPACGEIDIMEHVGYEPNVHHSATHTLSSSGNTVNKGKITLNGIENDFHIYGIIWTPESIKFYLDSPSQVFYTYTPSVKDEKTWPFDDPQFFLLNIAVGGTWGGSQGIDDTVFPQEMEVDYVRVYKL